MNKRFVYFLIFKHALVKEVTKIYLKLYVSYQHQKKMNSNDAMVDIPLKIANRPIIQSHPYYLLFHFLQQPKDLSISYISQIQINYSSLSHNSPLYNLCQPLH